MTGISAKTARRITAILDAEPGLWGPPGYDPRLDEIERGWRIGPYNVGIRHYDRDGDPITMRQWMVLHSDRDYVQVARDDLGPFFVSTVWLGLDHGWHSEVPIIFETMVFESELSYHDGLESEHGSLPPFEYHAEFDQRRYTTETQARKGHAEMVAEVLRHMKTDPRAKEEE